MSTKSIGEWQNRALNHFIYFCASAGTRFLKAYWSNTDLHTLNSTIHRNDVKKEFRWVLICWYLLNPTLKGYFFFAVISFSWSIIWYLSFPATYLPVMLNPIPICILSTLYYRAEGFVVTPQKQKKHSAKTIHAVVTPPKQSNEAGSKAKFKYQPSEFCSTESCSCVVSLHLSLSLSKTNTNTIHKIVHCTILRIHQLVMYMYHYRTSYFSWRAGYRMYWEWSSYEIKEYRWR